MKYQSKLYKRYAVTVLTTALVGYPMTSIVNAEGFSDLEGNAHKEAILSLVDQGIIKGYSDGTFRPFNRITRGDAGVMVARALGLLDGKDIPSTTFTDLYGVSLETQEAVAKLARLGVISGFTPESFSS